MLKEIIGRKFPGALIINTDITNLSLEHCDEWNFLRSINSIEFPEKFDGEAAAKVFAAKRSNLSLLFSGNGRSIKQNGKVELVVTSLVFLQADDERIFAASLNKQTRYTYGKMKPDLVFEETTEFPTTLLLFHKFFMEELAKIGVYVAKD